jgi:DNA-binding IclR family transcriptional regulator
MTPARRKSSRKRLKEPAFNRSLLRGIEILRAFRPGVDLLGNGELAERTRLPRATVSRLTQTLTSAGLLDHDRRRRAYRLAAPVLSFAHAMRLGSPVLAVAAPLMRELAEKRRINVGLAVADRDVMVYLESIRYNRKVSLRNVVAGQRIPIDSTSLGRTYLAVVSEARRKKLLSIFKRRREAGWARVMRDIDDAIESVHRRGYCVASWQPGVVALATPILVEGHPIYVLNVSVTSDVPQAAAARHLGEPLMGLAASLVEAIRRL